LELGKNVVQDQIGDLVSIPGGKQPVIKSANHFYLETILAVDRRNDPEAGLAEALDLSAATDQEHVSAAANQVLEAFARSVPETADPTAPVPEQDRQAAAKFRGQRR
jgi:hypothetical protein